MGGEGVGTITYMKGHTHKDTGKPSTKIREGLP